MVHIVELHADGTEEQLTQLPDDDMAEADGSTSSDAASAAAASADPLRLLLGRRASALTRSPRAPSPPHLPLLIDLSGGCGGVRFPLIATGSARFSWPPPVARAAADEDEAMDGGGVPRANTTPHAMRAHPSSTSLYDSFTESGKRARPGGTAPSPCRGGVAAAMASSSSSSFASPPTFDSTDGLDGLVDGMLHVGASPAKRSRVTPVPLSAASILGLGAAGAAAVGAAPHPPAPPASRIGTPTPEPRNLFPPRAGASGGGGGSGNDAPPPTPCGAHRRRRRPGRRPEAARPRRRRAAVAAHRGCARWPRAARGARGRPGAEGAARHAEEGRRAGLTGVAAAVNGVSVSEGPRPPRPPDPGQ